MTESKPITLLNSQGSLPISIGICITIILTLLVVAVLIATTTKELPRNQQPINTATPTSNIEVTNNMQSTNSDKEVFIEVPKTWKEFSYKEDKVKLTLKVPTGYEFQTSPSEVMLVNSDTEDYWVYFDSIGIDPNTEELKNYYDNTSRRVWYSKWITSELTSGTYEGSVENNKVLAVKEHFINGISYLEIDKKNYGNTFKVFLYVQNGIVHMFEQTGKDSNRTLDKNIGLLFYTLKSEIL